MLLGAQIISKILAIICSMQVMQYIKMGSQYKDFA